MLNTGTQTAFVNGCFDVLHYGHLKLLEYAKSQADILVVGIDSDMRVSKNKGPTRPFNSQKIRKYFLESLVYTDKVIVFDDDEQLTNLVKSLKPHIMIVGKEYENKKVIGSEYAKEVKFFERIGEHSTTKILQNTFSR
jgi:D-beta-D-heptose 7-phosphate kinase/D-beta-D-heptose 1-phosphate adenosyltransferase